MKHNHKSFLLSSLGGLLLSLSPLAFGQTNLAVVIANDAGGPPEDYQNYADSLAITLKMLSPAQLEEVFQGGVPSLATSIEESEFGPEGELDSLGNGVSSSSTGIGPETEGEAGNEGDGGSEPEDVNLTPEYEEALDNLLQAQSDVNLAQAALDAAIALLEFVLKDEGGLISDDIRGNFIAGVVKARDDVATARENLASAREQEIKAQNEFDKF